MVLLEFSDVVKKFDKFIALDKINWQVKRGRIHALLGHNGSGKTTSFLIANKLLPFDTGSVILNGQNIAEISDSYLKKTGFLTEKLRLYRDLSVVELLRFFADIFAVKNPQSKVDYLLTSFNMTDFKKKKIKDLSTGMYKKVALALTLINDPELVFLDEPFSGLDPLVLKEISQLIVRYRDEFGTTFVISSHDLNELDLISEDVTIIKKGQNVISDTLSGLYKQYNVKPSYRIDYLSQDKETSFTATSDQELFDKLNEIQKNQYPLLGITAEKLKLSEIYRDIYGSAD